MSDDLGFDALLNEKFAEYDVIFSGEGLDATLDVSAKDWHDIALMLRDDPALSFEQLIDLCAVDFLSYGTDEWETQAVSSEGFSRGIDALGAGRFDWASRPEAEQQPHRYAVVVHLLSIRHNRRLRLRAYCDDDVMPSIASLDDVWPVANWFEREAFDLFGVAFVGHPDLRRILTDYGFVGHPFRKDFPLVGNVEVRYDPVEKRVMYQPVTIEPRVLVPRVIRDDSRYQQANAEKASAGGEKKSS